MVFTVKMLLLILIFCISLAIPANAGWLANNGGMPGASFGDILITNDTGTALITNDAKTVLVTTLTINEPLLTDDSNTNLITDDTNSNVLTEP